MTNAANVNDFDPSEYPFANSRAAKMLAEAFQRASDERGLSQRQLAKSLNYKNSVMLSHMTIGRAPVPIDRVPDLCRILKIDMGEFMIAVLEQRHPELDWVRILAPLAKGSAPKKAAAPSLVVNELEAIARSSLDDLPVQQINVLREVVATRDASRRWLNISEVSVVEQLRRARPNGMTPAEVAKLSDCIADL